MVLVGHQAPGAVARGGTPRTRRPRARPPALPLRRQEWDACHNRHREGDGPRTRQGPHVVRRAVGRAHRACLMPGGARRNVSGRAGSAGRACASRRSPASDRWASRGWSRSRPDSWPASSWPGSCRPPSSASLRRPFRRHARPVDRSRASARSLSRTRPDSQPLPGSMLTSLAPGVVGTAAHSAVRRTAAPSIFGDRIAVLPRARLAGVAAGRPDGGPERPAPAAAQLRPARSSRRARA